MKLKHIILCVVCVVAIAVVFMFLLALKKHNAEVAKIEHIPDITLTSIEGETISLAELHPERKTAIMFFSTDCEFCQKEIEGILASKEIFTGIDWVFVTISPIEELEAFLVEYPLYSIPNAMVCIEDIPELFFALDVTSPPSLFIYDANGAIENYNRGAISIKTIQEWLK